MEARKFVFADFFPMWFLRMILEIPLFYFVSTMVQANVWLVVFMVFSKNMFALFVEALHLTYYDKTGKLLHKKVLLFLGLMVGFLVLGYYPAIKQIPFPISEQVIFLTGVICIVLGCLGLKYILNYKKFSIAINDANKLSDIAVNKEAMSKEAQFNNVKLKDNDYTREEIRNDLHSNKDGFAYINAIFFRRHKRILLRPISRQMVVIVFLFIAAYVMSYFTTDFHSKYIKLIKQSFAMFVFALYYMSTGQKAAKAMFYNCDISLLHYGFYTNSQAVLATFTVRVKYLIITNLLPALTLGGGLLLLDLLTGGSGLTLLPVTIMILVLSVFFSVHNLFLYYIFQPYTTDLSVKNPLFTLFNVLTYFLSYICLQLDGVPIGFLVGMIIVTTIYSLVALVLVYRLAPKTFVIK